MFVRTHMCHAHPVIDERERANLVVPTAQFSSRLNVRQASLHDPAAYFASFLQYRHLISRILGLTIEPSVHLPDTMAAARPDWSSIQDIDVPHSQHGLSQAIDEASFNALLDSALNVQACDLTG